MTGHSRRGKTTHTFTQGQAGARAAATRRPAHAPPLKVTFVVEDLGVGGMEVTLLRLANGLRQRNVSVRVLCTKGLGPLAPRFQCLGITLDLVPLKQKCCGRRALPRLIRYFRQTAPGVVHIRVISDMFWEALAAKLARVPILVQSRHSQGLWIRTRRLLWKAKFLNLLVDRTIAVSQRVALTIHKKENLPMSSIDIIYNGVPFGDIAAQAAISRTRTRRELGVPEDSLVLVTVGNLKPVKRTGLILQVLRKLIDDGLDAHLIVVGDGPSCPELEALSRELQITRRAHLLGSRNDVARILGASDVFLLASESEGLGNVVSEAMAARLPVVATRCGGPEEIIRDGDTGRLVPVNDANAMAEATKEILASPARARQMGQRGFERVRKLFSVDAMVWAHLEVYRNILLRKGCRHVDWPACPKEQPGCDMTVS